jgi:hypothetical protein
MKTALQQLKERLMPHAAYSIDELETIIDEFMDIEEKHIRWAYANGVLDGISDCREPKKYYDEKYNSDTANP